MRLIFAGTPEFAARTLDSLINSRHAVVAVFTQPDRPAGRGMKSRLSAVKQLALTHHLSLRQPASLRDAEEQQALANFSSDLLVVAAYGLILPQRVLDIPKYGALNIHASLLPRWRGAAPIQRAILAADKETGISIMRMEAGLDTGPVMLRESTSITAEDTAGTLHDRLADIGARLALEAIDQIERGCAVFETQARGEASYAVKLSKEEAKLDWRLHTEDLHRRVRAFNPFPGASAMFRSIEIKVWHATPIPSESGEPGTVIRVDAQGPIVACGKGALRLEELQKAGGKRLEARQWMRGFALAPGDKFSI